MEEDFMSVNSGVWLSIIEYSVYKNISISSIRRRIKANQVKYKCEDGKYFIYVSSDKIEANNLDQEKELLAAKLELEHLKLRIQSLEEENNDLKMLVNLYESGALKAEIPAIPQEL
jgi:cell shape-determining protein MreC